MREIVISENSATLNQNSNSNSTNLDLIKFPLAVSLVNNLDLGYDENFFEIEHSDKIIYN